MSEQDKTRDALDEFYRSLYRRTRSSGRAGGNRPWSRPLASDALAVHPEQIPEAIEDARKKGISIDFDSLGRPLFRDRNHRKRYCRAYGIYDRDGGYSDAQKGATALSGYTEPPPDYSHLDSACGPPGVQPRSTTTYFV